MANKNSNWIVFCLLGFNLCYGLSLGLKAGIDISYFPGDQTGIFNNPSNPKENPLLSFCPSVYLESPLFHSFSIVPEVSYSRKGEKYLYNDTLKSYNEISSDYIRTTISVKLRNEKWDKINPFIYIGPDLGILIESQLEAKDKGHYGNPFITAPASADSYTVDITKYFNRLDPGLAFGIGTDIYFGYQYLTIEVRYYCGFITANKAEIIGADNRAGNFLNNTITIQLGLNFREEGAH